MAQMQEEVQHPNLPLNQDEIDLIVKIVSSDEKLEIPDQLLSKNIDGSLEQIKDQLIQIDQSYDFEINHKFNKNNFYLIHLLSQLGKLQRIQDLSDDQLQKKTGSGYSPLILSIKYGKKEVVKYIISKFPDLMNNVANVMKFTLLHLASKFGQVEVAKLLLEKGASMDQPSKDGATALYLASRLGHLEVARLLLEQGADVNQANIYGMTALHSASYHRHVEIVRLLLEKGALVDQLSQDRATALYLASERGYLEVARLLLENGASVDQVTSQGSTPLHIASQNGHIATVRLLLDKRALVDYASKEGATALSLASQHGYVEIVRLLLEKGADVNQATIYGKTALHSASYHGHLEVARLLLDKGADVNQLSKDGVTALSLASQNGHIEIVRLLFEKGALVDQLSKDRATALSLASQNGHIEIVRLLLEKGALVDQLSKEGATALSLASYHGHLEVARLLLEKGALVDQLSKDRATALSLASQNGHIETVRLLLEKGALVNHASKEGATALYLASEHGHLEVARLLLEKGADVNHATTPQGFTTLHLAVELGHIEIVRLLLEKGADVDHASKERVTALSLASEYGHLEVARLLLEKGASMDHAYKDGATALHFASKHGHLEVVRLLLENGADTEIKDIYNHHFYSFKDLYENDEIMLKVSKFDVIGYINSEAKFDRLIYIIENSKHLKEIKLGNFDEIDDNLRIKILEAFDKNKSLIKIYPTNLASSEICENLCERNKSIIRDKFKTSKLQDFDEKLDILYWMAPYIEDIFGEDISPEDLEKCIHPMLEAPTKEWDSFAKLKLNIGYQMGRSEVGSDKPDINKLCDFVKKYPNTANKLLEGFFIENQDFGAMLRFLNELTKLDNVIIDYGNLFNQIKFTPCPEEGQDLDNYKNLLESIISNISDIASNEKYYPEDEIFLIVSNRTLTEILHSHFTAKQTSLLNGKDEIRKQLEEHVSMFGEDYVQLLKWLFEEEAPSEAGPKSGDKRKHDPEEFESRKEARADLPISDEAMNALDIEPLGMDATPE